MIVSAYGHRPDRISELHIGIYYINKPSSGIEL